MSTTYRRNTVVRSTSSRRGPPPPPPKKKRTGLLIAIIIGIILLIIIIIIIILLLRRKSSSSTTGKCTSNANCTGGKVCKTSTGVCVTCVDNSQCTGGQVCNSTTNTCQAPPCSTSADCTTASIPTCVAGSCKQCATNANCSSNTIYSTQNKNICDMTNNTCVQCNTAADCPSAPNATCTANVCCDVTPPTVTNTTPTLAADSSIGGNYTFVQPSTGVTEVSKLQARAAQVLGSINGDTMTVTSVVPASGSVAIVAGDLVSGVNVATGTIVLQVLTGTGGAGTYKVSRSQVAQAGTMNITRDIFSTINAAPTGTFSFVESAMGELLFPLTQYYVVIKLLTACGDVYSQPTLVTMPASPNDWFGQPTTTAADKNSTRKGFMMSGMGMIDLGDAPPGGNGTISGMIVTKNQGLHPNLVGKGTDNGHIVKNITGVGNDPLLYFTSYTAPWTGPPPVGNSPTEPVVGSTWYGRAFVDKAEVERGGILGNLSVELSAVVQP